MWWLLTSVPCCLCGVIDVVCPTDVLLLLISPFCTLSATTVFRPPKSVVFHHGVVGNVYGFFVIFDIEDSADAEKSQIWLKCDTSDTLCEDLIVFHIVGSDIGSTTRKKMHWCTSAATLSM
jgi:hypothetical protein